MVVGILLVIVGILGLVAGMFAFGDIGIACSIGGIGALLSGIAHIAAANKMKKMQSTIDSQQKAMKTLIEMVTRHK